MSTNDTAATPLKCLCGCDYPDVLYTCAACGSDVGPSALSAPAPAEPRDGDHSLASLAGRRWRLLNYAPQGSVEEGRYREELAKLDAAIAAHNAAPRPALPDAGEAVAWEVTSRASGIKSLMFERPPSLPERTYRMRPLVYGDAHPPAASAETARVAELLDLLRRLRSALAPSIYKPEKNPLLVEWDAALGAQEVQS